MADIQDPNIVFDIRQRLDGMHLYERAEVEAFGDAIVDPKVTHQKLYALTQPATDRFNGKLKTLTDAIEQWERALLKAEEAGDEAGAGYADAQRGEYCKQRDELLIFSESLSTFVRCYEYIAQLVDLGDPSLEAFASFARLLRKRLKGIGAEQVDLGDLKLSHYVVKPGEGLDGVVLQGESPGLYGITDNGLREARDREKKFLRELIERLNAALGKDVADSDQVMLALQVSETLRSDQVVMAQIHNNSREQAMRADLPARAVEAIVGAMSSHTSMATRLLSDEPSRELFITVLYELLKRDVGPQLLGSARP